MRICTVVILLFVSSQAFAAPSRKEAIVFVKELEATVNANDQVLKNGSTKALDDQGQQLKLLYSNAQTFFVSNEPSGVCINAAESAKSLWLHRRYFFRKQNKVGFDAILRQQRYYKENLMYCKGSIELLK